MLCPSDVHKAACDLRKQKNIEKIGEDFERDNLVEPKHSDCAAP